jgi:Fe-S cluster assembly protein SufD
MAEKKRRIIKRGRDKRSTHAKEFSFTREMIPHMSNGAQEPTFLTEYREKAWNAFEKIGFPNREEEAWRRTSLKNLAPGVFKVAEASSLENVPSVPDELLKPLAGDKYGGQIVLTPISTNVYLDKELEAQGVIFTDLATATQKHSNILEKMLGQVVRAEEGKFAALTGALAQKGVLLYVPKNTRVDKPLHSVNWGPGVGLAHFSHILIWVDDNADLTFVHEAASPEAEGQALHSGIVEIRVGDRANLNFVELQSWGKNVWNFSHERARVGQGGNLDWIFGGVGSRLTKNFTELDLTGEGARGRMSGFVFTEDNQHLDHDTQQNHLAANTTSDMLFKAALTGVSRSVWQGMIYVAPGAQKTDGYQANQNLMLSDDARADSIPGLEILADDVACTHGSTIGNLQEEEIFYLLTRGISREQAERLMVEGFFDPIMQRIPYEGVRSRFQQAIKEKIKSSMLL